MNHNKSTTLVTVVLGLAMGSTAHAACTVASATPFQAGPPNPNNGFAEYVRDSNGLALELCLSPSQPTLDPATGAVISPVGAAPFCFFDPPDPANAFSSQIGFGAEGFWWLASPDTTAFPATLGAVLVLGAEAAFLGDIADGEQFPFTRLRIRLDVPVTGFYRVTEPYGVHIYEVTALVAGNEINDSFDVEFTQGTIDANGTVTEATNDTNCVGPWLTWDTYPAGDRALTSGDGSLFIGDGATSHAVIGSTITTTAPNSTEIIPANLFRVEAFSDADLTVPLAIDPNDADGNGSNNSAETALFSVVGKVWDGQLATPLVAQRTTYTRDATGTTGQVDVFASGAATALASATAGPNINGTFALAADQGNFFESELLAPGAAAVPSVVELDATDAATDPTHLVSPLVDLVSISLAEYDLGVNPPTLTVNAASSDSFSPPTLTVVEFNQPLTAGTLAATEASSGVPLTPPGSITVVSSTGGSATRLVEVVNSDLDGDGVPNDTDNCPLTANAGQEDSDSDGVGDVCDNCTAVANADQRDTDVDGYGNICDADLTNDNKVNLDDYGAFRRTYGASEPLSAEAANADFNGDNVVNLDDYGIFRRSYGSAPGPSGLAP